MYRPELDALRFFAFLAVFVSHSLVGHTAGSPQLAVVGETGNFGVPVFFTLSAYLITDLLLREQSATGQIGVGNFYVRRILRIWPLYLTILLFYKLLGVAHPAFRIEWGRLTASLLMVGNWYILLHPAITTPLRALWSISVEEQFYLLWPLVAKFGGRLGLQSLSLMMFPAAAIAIAVTVPSQWYLETTIWLNSFVQFQFLAAGALLAIHLRGRVPRTGALLRLSMAAASLALFVCAAAVFHIKRPQPSHSSAALCSGYECLAAASLLVLLAALGMSGKYIPRWLAFLGRISYGLYVLHETAFLFTDETQKHLHVFTRGVHPAAALAANKFFALLITILLAMLSYLVLERPFLRLKAHYTVVASRPV